MNEGQDIANTGVANSQQPFAIPDFTDRRDPQNQRKSSGLERRQFTNSMNEYSPEAAELGNAIDQYKLMHRRRFINYEELLSVIKDLGYSKDS